MAVDWRNTETKPRGSFVRNVHPVNVGRMPDGLVLGEDGLGNLSVQTGRGSHVYGPAENWAPIDRAPEWLEEV